MLRVVGGANVPAMGNLRVSATWPLAVLTLEGTSLALKVRWFARLFRPAGLTVGPSSVTLVAPTKPAFGLGISGLDIALVDGRNFYFWTGQRDVILQGLAAAGFPISWDEHKARKVWEVEP